MVKLALAVALAACARPSPAAPPSAAAAYRNEATLFRDLAIVHQRVELSGPSTKVQLPVGVASDLFAVVDRAGLSDLAVHFPEADEKHDATEVTIDAPGLVGAHTITIAYLTARLHWDVAYTMTTTPARDRAVLHGAVAIQNTAGIELLSARTSIVDAELALWRSKTTESLAAALTGDTKELVANVTPRELGVIDLRAGETRVELIANPRPRPMRSVLVYDPIGTKLDHQSATPLRERELGATPPATPSVTESFEVERDDEASLGLPAGPVRLLERRTDGSLAVLGESRVFDAATRVAEVDTIAIGTADGVTGSREQRELTIDETDHRIVEEFTLEIANDRPVPVSVLIREHLYRGQNWTLAFHSAPSADKEGPQQIALRTKVPAKGTAKILYVVVYTWPK